MSRWKTSTFYLYSVPLPRGWLNLKFGVKLMYILFTPVIQDQHLRLYCTLYHKSI